MTAAPSRKGDRLITVPPDEYYSGWVEKRGRINTAWRKRFFVLEFDDVLKYYTAKDKQTLKGEIAVKFMTKRCYQIKTKDKSFEFAINIPKRLYVMRVESEEVMRAWIGAINNIYFENKKARGLPETPMATQRDNAPPEIPAAVTLETVNEDEEYVDDEEVYGASKNQDQGDPKVDPFEELKEAIVGQHGGNCLANVKHSILGQGKWKYAPELVFQQFYVNQERPNWNSRIGGYWEEILVFCAAQNINPDCVVEDRTFMHILAKDHQLMLSKYLYSLGPTTGMMDSRELTVLDYFIRTSTQIMLAPGWWDCYTAIIDYGYQSKVLERSWRQLRYQLEQKNMLSDRHKKLLVKARNYLEERLVACRKVAVEIPKYLDMTLLRNAHDTDLGEVAYLISTYAFPQSALFVRQGKSESSATTEDS